MSSSAAGAGAPSARRGRRQSSRAQNDPNAIEYQGVVVHPNSPASVGPYYSPYPEGPYPSGRQGEHSARPDSMQGVDYFQTRSGHATSAHFAYGAGQQAQVYTSQQPGPTYHNTSIGPAHLSVPTYPQARSHTPASTGRISTPVQHVDRYGQVYPVVPSSAYAHESENTRRHTTQTQHAPRSSHSPLKRAYDDFSRSATPASHSRSSQSTRASSQSPPPSASPTPSPSAWTPSPSPLIGPTDLARASNKGKQPSQSKSSRSRSRKEPKSSSPGSGSSSSRHRANPQGLPGSSFNTFSVTPFPATQLGPAGAMYMGALDLQSDTSHAAVEHGPTELPPRQYVGGSDAVSPWTPKKNLGTIPGSAMEYLPALEDRLSRLELNVNRYVEYRGEKAVKNAIAPDLKKPE